MTCWSCIHYRRDGCEILRSGWPEVGVRCPDFSYDPGSDEGEREDTGEINTQKTLRPSDCCV